MHYNPQQHPFHTQIYMKGFVCVCKFVESIHSTKEAELENVQIKRSELCVDQYTHILKERSCMHTLGCKEELAKTSERLHIMYSSRNIKRLLSQNSRLGLLWDIFDLEALLFRLGILHAKTQTKARATCILIETAFNICTGGSGNFKTNKIKMSNTCTLACLIWLV